MHNSQSIGPFVYAAFLVVAGIVGYSISPLHASTAIVGGVGGGFLVAGLSILNRKKVLWAQTGLRTAIAVFALTFAGRGLSAWKLVAEGLPDHLPIATLLSLMCVVSIYVILLLFRKPRGNGA